MTFEKGDRVVLSRGRRRHHGTVEHVAETTLEWAPYYTVLLDSGTFAKFVTPQHLEPESPLESLALCGTS